MQFHSNEAIEFNVGDFNATSVCNEHALCSVRNKGTHSNLVH